MRIRAMLSIALITLRELQRRKILYALFFACLALVAGSFYLKVFGLEVQSRLLIDLSLAGIGLFGILLGISLTLSLVPAEMEQRTLYPLLAKPINRSDFLLGKFLAVGALLVMNLGVLAILLMLLLYMRNHVIAWEVLKAMLLIGMQCLLVTGVCFLLSLLVSQTVNFFLSLLLFYLGTRPPEYMTWLGDRLPVPALGAALNLVKNILPHLEYFDVKSAVVQGFQLPPPFMGLALLYGVLYLALILVVCNWVFATRDL